MLKGKISQVKMGALISYMALAINVITGLIYTPWMVRIIGQSNYGMYTLATSLIAIFMLDFGLGSAVSRFVSKYRAEGNQPAVNRIIGVIYKLYIAIDILIVCALLIVFFLLDKIYVKLTPDELDTFRTLYLLVAGFNIISFPLSPLNGILNAYEKFIQLKLCDVFNKLFTVALVVIALTYSESVVSVVVANVASGLITIFIKLVIVRTVVPLKVDFKGGDKQTYKKLFGFTLWTTVISIMQRFTHSFSPSVLGMTSSSIEIALYSPAVVLEGYFYLLATAVNGLFLPRVSKFIADKEENKIFDLLIKVGRYQITFLGLIFVGFVCIGQDFMSLWMGPDYSKSYYCAVIIILPSLIGCSQQIAATATIAKNLIRYQAKFMVLSGVAGLFASYMLSIYLGSIGACLATAITAISNIVYMTTVYQRKAGINMVAFWKKSWLKAIPCYLFTIIIGIVLTQLIHIPGWLGLVTKALVVASIYAVVFILFYFSSEDRKSLLKRLKIKK